MITALYLGTSKTFSYEHRKELAKFISNDFEINLHYFTIKPDERISLIDLENLLRGINAVVIEDTIPIHLLAYIYDNIHSFELPIFIAYTEYCKIGESVISYDKIKKLSEIKME